MQSHWLHHYDYVMVSCIAFMESTSWLVYIQSAGQDTCIDSNLFKYASCNLINLSYMSLYLS